MPAPADAAEAWELGWGPLMMECNVRESGARTQHTEDLQRRQWRADEAAARQELDNARPMPPPSSRASTPSDFSSSASAPPPPSSLSGMSGMSVSGLSGASENSPAYDGQKYRQDGARHSKASAIAPPSSAPPSSPPSSSAASQATGRRGSKQSQA